MASKVNTKFVIILAASLVIVFGGLAGMMFYMQLRSGDRLVRKGDELFAAGEYKLAAEKYSRAVNKDQSRLDWIEKWRDALVKTTPPNQAQYTDAYIRQYMGILRKMGTLRPTEPDRQLPLIEEMERRFRIVPGAISVPVIQEMTTTMDEKLQRLDPTDPNTKKIIGIRGLVGYEEMLRFPVDDAKRERVLADLRVGAEGVPTDPRFQLGIVQWYDTEIYRIEVRENRPGDPVASDYKDKLAQERATLLEKFGSEPSVIVEEFQASARDAVRNARTPEQRNAVVKDLQTQAATLLTQVESIPIEKFSVEDFLMMVTALTQASDTASLPRIAAWADSFRTAHPEDPRTIIATARIFRDSKNYARAYEVYDTCVSLKDVPVSLEGVVLPSYRRIAAAERIDTALLQREEAKDPAEQARLLALAKEKRDALAAMVDVGSESELKLRDARIAVVEEDFSKAVALFDEIRIEGEADNPQILASEADALVRLGRVGDAKRLYERLIQLGQERPGVLIRLAEIELGLNNLSRGTELLERVLVLEPENEYAKQRLRVVKTAMQPSGTGDALPAGDADPIIMLLIKAQSARQEGNLPQARIALREALDLAPTDIRILRQAVGVELAAKDRPAAIKIAQEALAKDPERAELKALKLQVEIEDPVEAAIAVINASGDSPVIKALSLYGVYLQNNRPEEASKAFADAEKADPDFPAVIEVGFARSVRDGKTDNFARAAAYAERAAKLNIDERAGLTYQGRLEMARENFIAAEQTLQRAVQKLEYDPSSWRWLGQVQQRLGKVDLALASYDRAYTGDPRDVGIAAEYALLLSAAGQGPKAITVLSPEKGVLRYDPNNRGLLSLWLDMEAAYGDRDKAIQTRGRIFDSDPANISNLRQYFTLLLQDKSFDRAKQVVDALAKLPEAKGAEVALARARVLAMEGAQAESEDDRKAAVDAGRAIITEYAASVPEAERTDFPYIALAAFEREFGSAEGAMAALEAGSPYQNAKERQVDRALGDLLFALGDAQLRNAATATAAENVDEAQKAKAKAQEYFTHSEQCYSRVSESDPTSVDVKKRHAETLIRLEQFDRALALLQTIGNADDLQVLLLQENVAAKRGDKREMRAVIDRAVEKHPNNPLPFYRRALVNMGDPSRVADQIADLDQAVKLKPDFIEAWQLRVRILTDQGRMEDAISQLGLAVQANPTNDDLIEYYMGVLQRNGRADQAKKVAFDIATARVDDTKWWRIAALNAYDLGDYQQAETLYKKIYDMAPGPGPAMDLLNSYLRRENPPPSRAEVNRILPLIEKEENLTPGGKMLMARAKEFLGETAKAEEYTISAYKDAKTDPFASRLWFENVVLRFNRDREHAFEYVLTNKAYPDLPAIIRLLALRRDIAAGANPSSVLEKVEQLAPECAGNRYTQSEMLRVRNMMHYTMGDYEQAAKDCREGLALIPTDLEFNNNLAYVLANHMKDPRAALPYAEMAAKVAPTDPAVLDTLGWVYFQSEKYRDADDAFNRAIATSKTPDDLVPAYLHQAQNKQKLPDINEAIRLAKLAKTNVEKASPAIRDQYGPQIDALLTELNGGS